jgi:hypothetical protein
VNVNVPDGLVSDAAYISWMPPGNPVTITTAVSLDERIVIPTITGVPSSGTRTVWEFSDTVTGTIGVVPVTFMAHPLNTQASSASPIALRSCDDRSMDSSTQMPAIRAQPQLGRPSSD